MMNKQIKPSSARVLRNLPMRVPVCRRSANAFLRLTYVVAIGIAFAATLLSCSQPGGHSNGSIAPGETVGEFTLLTPGFLTDLVSPPYALNAIGWICTTDLNGSRVDVHGPIIHQGATQTINDWTYRKNTGLGQTMDTDTGTPLFRVIMTFTPAARVDGTNNRYEYSLQNLTSDLTGNLFRVSNPDNLFGTLSGPSGWSVREGTQNFIWEVP
jgi:hypothetical protein